MIYHVHQSNRRYRLAVLNNGGVKMLTLFTNKPDEPTSLWAINIRSCGDPFGIEVHHQVDPTSTTTWVLGLWPIGFWRWGDTHGRDGKGKVSTTAKGFEI